MGFLQRMCFCNESKGYDCFIYISLHTHLTITQIHIQTITRISSSFNQYYALFEGAKPTRLFCTSWTWQYWRINGSPKPKFDVNSITISRQHLPKSQKFSVLGAIASRQVFRLLVTGTTNCRWSIGNSLPPTITATRIFKLHATQNSSSPHLRARAERKMWIAWGLGMKSSELPIKFSYKIHCKKTQTRQNFFYTWESRHDFCLKIPSLSYFYF